MSRRASALWILLFGGLAVAGGGLSLVPDRGGSGAQGASVAGRVVRVVDGDTIKVRRGRSSETVRYIGVDTPETVKPDTPVQCFGKRASTFNRRLVAGRRVRLRFGRERRDRYGRLLAYVYTRQSKLSVSALLISGGYGRELTIPPNTAHAEAFARLERRARMRGRGLWSACPADAGHLQRRR
jgi:micrococcal nuclease